MKNTIKLLSVLLVIALLSVGLVVGIFAADEPEATYDDARNQVNVDKTLSGNVYAIVYASENDFNADKKDGIIDLKGEGGAAVSPVKTFKVGDTFKFDTGVSDYYVYFVNDYTLEFSSKISFKTTNNYVLDLGGNKLSLLSNAVTIDMGADTNTFKNGAWVFGADSAVDITFKNGNMNIENNNSSMQIFSARVGSSMTFKDLDIIIANYGQNCLIQDSGCVALTFDNVSVDNQSTSKCNALFNRRGTTYQYIMGDGTGKETVCELDGYTVSGTTLVCDHVTKEEVTAAGRENKCVYTLNNFTCHSETNAVFAVYVNYTVSHSKKVGTVSYYNQGYMEDDFTVNFTGTNTFTGKASPINYVNNKTNIYEDKKNSGSSAYTTYDNPLQYVNLTVNYSVNTSFEYSAGLTNFDFINSKDGSGNYVFAAHNGYSHTVKFLDGDKVLDNYLIGSTSLETESG